MEPDFLLSEEHSKYLDSIPEYRWACRLAEPLGLLPEVVESFWVYLEAGESRKDAATFALDDWEVPLRPEVIKTPPGEKL